MSKTRLERMTDKHNGFADDVSRLRARRDKIIAQLCRSEARLTAAIRAVARSTKRLDKERALQFNAPLSPLPERVREDAREAKEAAKTNGADKNSSPPKPPRAKKPRRTPDDFKAEMTARGKPAKM